jgi:hypothetical protein
LCGSEPVPLGPLRLDPLFGLNHPDWIPDLSRLVNFRLFQAPATNKLEQSPV